MTYDHLESEDEMHDINTNRAVRGAAQGEAALCVVQEPAPPMGRFHQIRIGIEHMPGAVSLVTGAVGDVA